MMPHQGRTLVGLNQTPQSQCQPTNCARGAGETAWKGTASRYVHW